MVAVREAEPVFFASRRRHTRYWRDWSSGVCSSDLNPYCYELYVRGLDSYVWSEGYIARGPRAGTLTTAAVPYLPGRDAAAPAAPASRKVYDGPYPQ